MKTENLSTLKIHKLTQEQYDRELAAGRIDENAIYLTPDEEIIFPVDSVNGKTGAVNLSASDVGAATEKYVDDSIVTYSLSKSGSKIVLTGSDGSTSMVDDATSSGSGGTDGMEREFQMTVGGQGQVTPSAPKTQMYVVDVEHRYNRYCKTFLIDWMQVYLHGSKSYFIDYDNSTQSTAFLNCSMTNDGLVSFEIDDDVTNWEFSSIVGYY